MLRDGVVENRGSCLNLIGVEFLSSRMEGDDGSKYYYVNAVNPYESRPNDSWVRLIQ